jgi:hypothetical protein
MSARLDTTACRTGLPAGRCGAPAQLGSVATRLRGHRNVRPRAPTAFHRSVFVAPTTSTRTSRWTRRMTRSPGNNQTAPSGRRRASCGRAHCRTTVVPSRPAHRPRRLAHYCVPSASSGSSTVASNESTCSATSRAAPASAMRPRNVPVVELPATARGPGGAAARPPQHAAARARLCRAGGRSWQRRDARRAPSEPEFGSVMITGVGKAPQSDREVAQAGELAGLHGCCSVANCGDGRVGELTAAVMRL